MLAFGDIMVGVFILFFLIILIISFLFDSCWALAPKAKAALKFFFPLNLSSIESLPRY